MRPRISIRGYVRPSIRGSVRNAFYFSMSQLWVKWQFKCSKLIKSSELSQIVPKCPKMSTSDASLSEWTCFLFVHPPFVISFIHNFVCKLFCLSTVCFCLSVRPSSVRFCLSVRPSFFFLRAPLVICCYTRPRFDFSFICHSFIQLSAVCCFIGMQIIQYISGPSCLLLLVSNWMFRKWICPIFPMPMVIKRCVWIVHFGAIRKTTWVSNLRRPLGWFWSFLHILIISERTSLYTMRGSIKKEHVTTCTSVRARVRVVLSFV